MIVVSSRPEIEPPEAWSDPVELRAMDAALASIEHIAPHEVGTVRRLVTGNPANARADRVTAWKLVHASSVDGGTVAERLAFMAAERACHRQLDHVQDLAQRALEAEARSGREPDRLVAVEDFRPYYSGGSNLPEPAILPPPEKVP